MILPSCFSVCLLVWTSEASSNTRFMYSSNPVMWPSILQISRWYQELSMTFTLCWHSHRARQRPWSCSGGSGRWGWWAGPSPSELSGRYRSSSQQSTGASESHNICSKITVFNFIRCRIVQNVLLRRTTPRPALLLFHPVELMSAALYRGLSKKEEQATMSSALATSTSLCFLPVRHTSFFTTHRTLQLSFRAFTFRV